MIKKITSTTLKQETRKVIQNVIETEEPAVVYSYNEPKIILIKFDQELISEGKLDMESVKKYMFSAGKKKFDSAKYFRKLRDEE